MARAQADFEQSIFINCPFDANYRSLFEAIVFVVLFAGYQPRCALESSDSGEPRIEKLLTLISSCGYGIHDISRTELSANRLPRFNMPFELGIDLGCRRFGNRRERTKKLLVLDRRPYRYQKFLSDIAGQDIEAHSSSPRKAIFKVRDWLAAASPNREDLHGGDYIWRRYQVFCRELPPLCERLRLHPDRLTFRDFFRLARIWIEENEV